MILTITFFFNFTVSMYIFTYILTYDFKQHFFEEWKYNFTYAVHSYVLKKIKKYAHNPGQYKFLICQNLDAVKVESLS
jgi:hypothetical protein